MASPGKRKGLESRSRTEDDNNRMKRAAGLAAAGRWLDRGVAAVDSEALAGNETGLAEAGRAQFRRSPRGGRCQAAVATVRERRYSWGPSRTFPKNRSNQSGADGVDADVMGANSMAQTRVIMISPGL